jgi:hypothetical protein
MASSGYQSNSLRAAEQRRALRSFGDLGPGALAVAGWQALGLELPDVTAMRVYCPRAVCFVSRNGDAGRASTMVLMRRRSCGAAIRFASARRSLANRAEWAAW